MTCITFPCVLALPESTLDSDEFCHDCEQSRTWRGKPSPQRTWSQRLKRESWMRHLCTRTFADFHSQSTEDSWISYLLDSRASRSVTQASERESGTSDISGRSFAQALKSYSPAHASSRTWKESLLPLALGTTQFSTMSSVIWNSWVSERQQDASLAEKLARRTAAAAGSSSDWPTPTVAEGGKISCTANFGQQGLSNHPAIQGKPGREKREKSRGGLLDPTHASTYGKSRGLLNPAWVEQLMGFPTGWTDLGRWETHAYQTRFPMLTPNCGEC